MTRIAGFTGQFRFLSNFYPSVVRVCGIDFPTVEHAYQALKSVNEADWRWMATLPTPGAAKRAGRSLTLRENWDSLKLPVMRLLLRQKFKIPELQAALLLTHSFYLEETNTWGDTFWGVCNGVGQNHLGKLLMEVRSELRRATFPTNYT